MVRMYAFKKAKEVIHGIYFPKKLKIFVRNFKNKLRLRSKYENIDISPEKFHEIVKVESGLFDESKLSLYSIFKDEIYFCQAFFEHYRSIGIEQFLILDDGSKDGTQDFIKLQKDCVLLKSDIKFGQRNVVWIRPDGEIKLGLGEIALKCLIPNHFFKEKFALYVDADEFLLLPPKVKSLSDIVYQLKLNNDKAVAAQLVELFPHEMPHKLKPYAIPETADELLSAKWYYEPRRLVAVTDGKIKTLFGTKTELLHEKMPK